MFQIELTEKKEQPVLFIRTVTDINKLLEVTEEAQNKINKYIKESGGKAIDVPYSRYHKTTQTEVDLEIGIPVASSLPGKGEIESGIIPAGKYVVAKYSGLLKDMDKTHDGILKWIYEEDLKPTGPYFGYTYEVDDTNPEIEISTKIIVPVH